MEYARHVKVGDVIDGRFAIERELGSGGMGVVFVARDTSTGAHAALKVMHGGARPGDDHTLRFLREAEVLSTLSHEAIVAYLGHGVTGAGAPWMAMELLDGDDLEARLSRGALGVDETLALTRRIAGALGAAHARGVVHRDLKPANVFLPAGSVLQAKLLDFGAARLVRARRMTQTGALVGTPHYMSPEQARGAPADASADVFALGVMVFECLTGRPPWLAEDLLPLLAKILVEPAPPLDGVAPPWLARLVSQMLDKDPSARPRDGGAVVAELDRAAGPTGIPSALPPPSRALGVREQQIVSVILAGGVSELGETVLPGDEARALRTKIAEATASFKVPVDVIGDDAVLAVVAGAGVPRDRAALAARLALRVREVVGATPIVVATGRAEVGERGGVPVGEVVDRAAALLASTPAESIRIDPLTRDLLEGRFGLGADEGGATLIGPPRASNARLRVAASTPFIGRERELRTLVDAMMQSAEEPSAIAMIVSAAAGVGKSRLLSEMLARVPEEVLVLHGRGDSVTAGSPHALLADALTRHFKLGGAHTAAEKAEALRSGVSVTLAPERAAVVSRLFGAALHLELQETARRDPTALGAELRAAFVEWLCAETARRPVVIVLDDAQWGDLPSLEAVDDAIRDLADAPLAAFAFARPEITTVFPDLWRERDVSEVRLSRLGRSASAKLARAILPDAAEETIDLVIRRSDGNALALEENVRALRGGAEGVPETVLGLVEARLATLPDDAKRLMRAASVFGEAFPIGGAAALVDAAVDAPIVRLGLDALRDKEILEAADPTDTSGEVRFRHPLVREAAYATLTSDDRRLGHRLAAEWLEAGGHRDGKVLGEHWLSADEPARAADWLEIGAAQALAAHDFGAAHRLASRAVDLGATGAKRGRAHAWRAIASHWQGAHRDALTHAELATRDLDPGTHVFYLVCGEGVAASGRVGDADALRAWIERLEAAPTEAGADATRTIARCRAVLPMMQSGLHGMSLAQELLTEKTEDPRARAQVLEVAGVLALARGDWPEIARVLSRAVDCWAECGDDRNRCLAQVSVGWALAQAGDFDEAMRWLETGVALAERVHVTTTRTWADIPLAMVLAGRGRIDEALVLAERAVAALRRQGNRRQGAWSRVDLSSMYYTSERYAEAEGHARQALADAEGLPPVAIRSRAMLARSLTALGRAAEALPLAREAQAALTAFPNQGIPGELDVPMSLVESLEALGLTDEAAATAESARARVAQLRAYFTDEGWARFSALPHVAPVLATFARLQRPN